MTTYAYRIILNDSELGTVRSALERYREICTSELAAGQGSPYRAHLTSIDAVLARLMSDVQMTSTNSTNTKV
jgi:hypothetical protein